MFSASSNEGSYVLINDMPSYISKNMLAIILSKQGFKYSTIRIEASRDLTTGQPVACACVGFDDSMSPLAWIQVNQGELKFDGGISAKMEFSNTDRLDAIIEIRHNILEASSRRRIENDPSNRTFDRLFEEHRQGRYEDEYGAPATSRVLSRFARHKEHYDEYGQEREDSYIREYGREEISQKPHYGDDVYSLRHSGKEESAEHRPEYQREDPYHRSRDPYEEELSRYKSSMDADYEAAHKRRRTEYDSPKDEYFYENRRRHPDEGTLPKPPAYEIFESEQRPPPTGRCWTCHKCNTQTPVDKLSCLKCGISKKDSEAIAAKGNHLIGLTPCDTILIRELPLDVYEDSIRRELGKYRVSVQRIRLAESKQYCLVQLRSIQDAIDFMNAIKNTTLFINNCLVITSFSRQSLNQIVQEELKAVQNFQQLILPDTTLPPPPVSVPRAEKPRKEYVTTPVGTFPVCVPPNPEVFQFEQQSGYFYDPNTDFYYDPSSQYYYDVKDNIWRFWSSKYSTYIPCEGMDESRRRLFEDDGSSSRPSDHVGGSRAAEHVWPPPENSAIDLVRNVIEQSNVLVNALVGAPPPTIPIASSSSNVFNPYELALEAERQKRKSQSYPPREELPPMTIEHALAETARRQKMGKLTGTCQLCNNPKHKIKECWAPVVCARCGQFNHMHKECKNQGANIDFINNQITYQQQIIAWGLKLRGEEENIGVVDATLAQKATPSLVSVSNTASNTCETCLNCSEGHNMSACPLPLLCVNCGSRKHLLHQCGAPIATPDQMHKFNEMRRKVFDEYKAMMKAQEDYAKEREKVPVKKVPEVKPKKLICANCRSEKHTIDECTMPFVRYDILTGKDPLSSQLDKIKDWTMTSKDLRLCQKCSQIGHHHSACVNAEVDSSMVNKMRELIILYKHKRKMEKKDNPDDQYDPEEPLDENDLLIVDEVNEGDDEQNEHGEDMEGDSKDSKEEMSDAKNRSLRKKKLADNLKELQMSDFGYMPVSDTCLNCDSHDHMIDECTMPLINPEMNGEDILSEQLKKFFPDKRPNLAQFHELYIKNFCKRCAEFGHIEDNCPELMINSEKLAFMHRLVLLYVHSKKIEKHDNALDQSSSRKSSDVINIEEESTTTERKPSGNIEYKDSLRTVTGEPVCVNCLEVGHLIEDCSSDKINEEVDGSDAFSRSLRFLVQDGNIKIHHFEVCPKCAGLAHSPQFCVYPNKATEKQYWGMMRLRSIYLHAMKVTNSNGPAYTGNKKKDMASLAFEQPDVLPIEVNNSRPILGQEISDRDDVLEEILSTPCINCRLADHNIKNCPLTLVNTELNGNDPLCRQLRLIAPDGQVTDEHLAVCRKCVLAGHLTEKCSRKIFGNRIEYKKLVRLSALYNHAMKMTNSSGPAFKSGSSAQNIVSNISVKDISPSNDFPRRDELPPMTVEFALAEVNRRKKAGRSTDSCQLCNNPDHKIKECWAPIVCSNCGQFNHMHKECNNPQAPNEFINSQIVYQQQIIAHGLKQREENGSNESIQESEITENMENETTVQI